MFEQQVQTVRMFLQTVAGIGDENPEVKGLALTTVGVLTAGAVVRSLWGVLRGRRKPQLEESEERVLATIDVPEGTRVELKIGDD